MRTGEIFRAPSPSWRRSVREGFPGRTADMHVLGEVGLCRSTVNQPNKAAIAAAEAGEGRAQMAENIGQPRMFPDRRAGNRMSQGLDGVRKAARRKEAVKLFHLLAPPRHHTALLRDSFYALLPSGVAGSRWCPLAVSMNLRPEGRLVDLRHRPGSLAERSGRSLQGESHIPKADGRQRPLGVAVALEDKIVQQAVVTILNQIYEVDFRGFFLRVPPGPQRACRPHQAARCARGRTGAEEGELGAGCGHPWLLR